MSSRLCVSTFEDFICTSANQPQPAQNQPKYQILFHNKWLTAWLIYYTDFDLQCVVDLCQKGEKVNSIFSSEWCNGPKWKVSLCVFSKLSKNCQLSQLGLGCGGGEWGGKGQTIYCLEIQKLFRKIKLLLTCWTKSKSTEKVYYLKSVHFKKLVTRSSFLSKKVLIFNKPTTNVTTLFERNEDCVTDFLKWTDFKRNSNFRKFCWVIRTQPVTILKIFLL